MKKGDFILIIVSIFLFSIVFVMIGIFSFKDRDDNYRITYDIIIIDNNTRDILRVLNPKGESISFPSDICPKDMTYSLFLDEQLIDINYVPNDDVTIKVLCSGKDGI